MPKRNKTITPELPAENFWVEYNLKERHFDAKTVHVSFQNKQKNVKLNQQQLETEGLKTRGANENHCGWAFCHIAVSQPSKYNEAIQNDKAHRWREAKELMGIKTWELMEEPHGIKYQTWPYWKREAIQSTLCGQNIQARKRVDYNETFAPTWTENQRLTAQFWPYQLRKN